MDDTDFLEKWLPIETRLRAVEEKYRVERLRHNGRPHPEGNQLTEIRNDISAALDIYICATAEQRSIMRDLIEWSYLLPNHVAGYMYLPKELPNDEMTIQALHRALAAVSLENNKMDYRDTFGALSRIWLALDQRQINPQPYFREAAEWSSPAMRQFLEDFPRSAYFEEAVAPHLQSQQ